MMIFRAQFHYQAYCAFCHFQVPSNINIIAFDLLSSRQSRLVARKKGCQTQKICLSDEDLWFRQQLQSCIQMIRKVVNNKSGLILGLKYNYTPVSNYKIQNKINPIVSVTLGNDGQTLFDLHFRLFENVVPRTAENFKRLLLGTANYRGRNLSLIGNHFHHVVPRAYAEIGHLEGGNCSIFGPTFRDESFELPHDRPGLLSCVSEENTNNSRFLITYAPCPFLDLKNVVFGQVTAETFQHIRTLEKLGSSLTGYKIVSSRLLQIPQEEHHH